MCDNTFESYIYNINLGYIDNKKSIWQRAMRYMNYKPGWWALYFVYCSIPISLYVWYLTRRSKDVV